MSEPLSILKRLIVIKNNRYGVAFSGSHLSVQPATYLQQETSLRQLAYNWERVKAYEGNRTENCFLIGMFLGQQKKSEVPREKWDTGGGSGGEGIVAKATNQRW